MPHSIPGAKVLLNGPTGSGKTHSLRTFIEAGITPFILFTEPGMRTVSDISCEDGLHFKYVPPATPTWNDLYDNAKKINTMSFKSLAQLSDMNKQKYGQFLELVTTMNDFVCDRCGQHFGDVSQWGTDRALCVDSLSGLNIMAMDMVVGAKPVKAMGDWGVAMDNLERYINGLVVNTQCHFVLTAHLEREQDEVTGAVHLMPATLGRKLAPRMPRFFDDVILCKNEEGKFTWATTGLNVELKWRNLSAGKDLPPSFVPLIESWKKAGGVIQPAQQQETA